MVPVSDSSPAVSEAVGQRTHPLTGVVNGALWAAAAVFGLFSSFAGGEGWKGVLRTACSKVSSCWAASFISLS